MKDFSGQHQISSGSFLFKYLTSPQLPALQTGGLALPHS